ncbi:MAG: hypothetical protein ACRCYP_06035 [Alphaproteobacteria bacterium]
MSALKFLIFSVIYFSNFPQVLAGRQCFRGIEILEIKGPSVMVKRHASPEGSVILVDFPGEAPALYRISKRLTIIQVFFDQPLTVFLPQKPLKHLTCEAYFENWNIERTLEPLTLKVKGERAHMTLLEHIDADIDAVVSDAGSILIGVLEAPFAKLTVTASEHGSFEAFGKIGSCSGSTSTSGLIAFTGEIANPPAIVPMDEGSVVGVREGICYVENHSNSK